MKETFWEKRQQSLENITSERGIQLRMNRSIQVEGAFGLIKNDFGFRRFLTTGKKNIRIELLFLALGFNLKKRWMKQQKRRLETHYSKKKAAQEIKPKSFPQTDRENTHGQLCCALIQIFHPFFLNKKPQKQKKLNHKCKKRAAAKLSFCNSPFSFCSNRSEQYH